MFHCYTSTFRKHELPQACFVLSSENCVIIKACSSNLTGEVTAPGYSENINLKVPYGLSIIFLLSKRMLFYLISLNFSNSDFNHITMGYFVAFIHLAQVCEHSVNSLHILRVILWKFSKEKKQQVNTVRYCFSFIKHQNPFFHWTKKKEKKYKHITPQCSFSSHGDHSMKLSHNHKHCDDGQWLLTNHCFKHWTS